MKWTAAMFSALFGFSKLNFGFQFSRNVFHYFRFRPETEQSNVVVAAVVGTIFQYFRCEYF